MTRANASSNWRADRAAASSSSEGHHQDPRARSQSTPDVASRSDMAGERNVSTVTMIQAPSRPGHVTVSVAAESNRSFVRELQTGRLVPNMLALSFLNGKLFNGYNAVEWFGPILAHVATLLFVVASTSDVSFIEGMHTIHLLLYTTNILSHDLRTFPHEHPPGHHKGQLQWLPLIQRHLRH